YPAGCVLHGVAGVEQNGDLRIGFAAVAFEIAALGASEEIPVHVAQVVSGHVGPVLGEFLAEAKIRRAMQAGDKAVHDRLCEQVQRGDTCQYRGIEESLLHQLSPGRGTWAMSRVTISSASIRSDSAWKFRRSLCRRIGATTEV